MGEDVKVNFLTLDRIYSELKDCDDIISNNIGTYEEFENEHNKIEEYREKMDLVRVKTENELTGGYGNKLKNLLCLLKSEVKGEESLQLAKSGMKFEFNNGNLKRKKKQILDERVPTASNLFSGGMTKRQLHCVFCDKSHESKDCFLAQNWSLDKKKESISNKKVCCACFKRSHRARESSCKRSSIQTIHAIMCFELPANKRDFNKCETIDSSNVLMSKECSEAVLLQTIFVNIGVNRKQKSIRALIDISSQNLHILKRTAEKLGLVPVLDQLFICGKIARVKRGLWNKELREKKIWIADYGEGSPEIELLIGAGFCGPIFTELIHKLECGLIAYETYLGWVLMGRTSNVIKCKSQLSVAESITMLPHCEKIEHFWDLELLGIKEPKISREEEVVKLFNDTLSTDFDGRYMMRLPWTDNSSLPDNKNIAGKKTTFDNIKTHLSGRYSDYNSFLKSWKDEQIIEEVFESRRKEKGFIIFFTVELIKNARQRNSDQSLMLHVKKRANFLSMTARKGIESFGHNSINIDEI
ncbi:integrase_H2C2 domain-containing protein [Trichonephila inaurata madagascariensis]|uniref:Integrase_H2C2 domain-containing protein n=1 Tax=Trichonephila inaurata madagascariensis TaxID=2747483 RepID=A0A8X7BT08_9ARAC|nr:integrase_H2C2 domain-containing protein [Trichonephila inaurata madagascariensis]